MMSPSISMKRNRKFFIPELPTHIVFEILTRLPIRTLLNCRLVCKDWLFLISDPHFATTHLSNFPISLLIKPTCNQQIRLIDVSVQTLHNSHPANAQLISESKLHYPLIGERIENSCNGLLCSKDIFGYVFITNPILGEYISLPEACHVGKFDGTISAIGFSPLNNKYKVIQFSLKRDSFDPITGLIIYREEAEADIYTLGEGLWRSLGRVPYHLSKHSFNASVNGALHWLNFTADSPDFIRCFDFGSEQFQVVPEPREFGLEKKSLTNRMSVCVLRDCLAVCDFSSSLHVEIWIMKHYKIQASWCKDFVIEKVTVKGRLFSYCEPIMILKSGKILMLVNKDTLLQYNPKLGSFKDLKIYGIESGYYRAVGHIQSFVSPAHVAKGERCTVYYKRMHTEILGRMLERMNGQSSGCYKQLDVHCNPTIK